MLKFVNNLDKYGLDESFLVVAVHILGTPAGLTNWIMQSPCVFIQIII